MSNLNQCSDEELIRQFLSGSKKAFDALQLRHELFCYEYFNKRAPSQWDKDVMVQDVFYKVLNKIAGLNQASLFESWLRRICQNYLYNKFRQENTYFPYKIFSNNSGLYDDDGYLLSSIPPSQTTSPIDNVIAKERQEMIQDCLKTMKPRRQQILRLWLNGKTYKQISATLNMKEGTVMSSLHYVRKKLSDQGLEE